MKRTITLILFALCLTIGKAQTASVTVDFESFTLSPNSAYSNTNNVAFTSYSVAFQHKWDTSFGGFWAGDFVYTNKLDSSNGTFTNLYGVKPYKGYNSSDKFAVGQNKARITLSAPSTTVDGFYITNTTYAYKVVGNGNSFSRKFGDTTGTGSGTTIAQGAYPDFFKVTVKGYDNGALKSDSIEFYLADYKFSNNAQDYIVNNWQWVNTTTLGEVDSLKFFMYTSDNGQFGPNTPLFFALDNFTIKYSTAGIHELSVLNNVNIYPNPVVSDIIIENANNLELEVCLMSMNGSMIKQERTVTSLKWDLDSLSPGIYMIRISDGTHTGVKKLVKH